MFNFKKLFGKKNDGFFLQLEDEDATSTPAAKTEPKPKVETEAKVSAPPAAPATIVPVAPVAVAPVAPVAAPVSTTAAPAAILTILSKGAVASPDKKTAKAEEKAAEKAVKAAKRAAAKGEAVKAELAKVVAPAAAPVAVPTAPAITNFATDYLIKPSSISGRRMPGANMKGFLDLARQVEKPKPFKPAGAEQKAKK